MPVPMERTDDAVLHPRSAANRQRSLLLRIVRIAFIVLFTVVTLLAILKIEPGSGQTEINFALGWPLTISTALVLAALVLLIDVLTPTKKISTLFSVFFGLFGAMVATVGFGFIIDLLASTYDIDSPELVGTVKVLMGIALAYLGITVVLQTQDDFRLVIPYVEFSKQLRGPRPMIVDTSALIDGRFIDVAARGLVQSPVIVPKFVVDELHALADQPDKLKRGRGRRGLDAVGRLQRVAGLEVLVDDTPVAATGVDHMLVELASEMQGTVVTTDSGLARVAKLRNIPLLNVHELAAALRPTFTSGESLSVRIQRRGEQPGQGVGYLDDGSMVVAEGAAESVGRDVQVVVSSTLQTAAGRLIFGRVASEGSMSTGVSSGASSGASTRGATSSPAPGEASAGDVGAGWVHDQAGGEGARGEAARGGALSEARAAGSDAGVAHPPEELPEQALDQPSDEPPRDQAPDEAHGQNRVPNQGQGADPSPVQIRPRGARGPDSGNPRVRREGTPRNPRR
ncbi:MAG: PIN/TRAM domain-containing protein [Planctomycetota bacterium]|nr:PIN/TRAM domain-containing protein [Planctomycetota bacterium]